MRTGKPTLFDETVVHLRAFVRVGRFGWGKIGPEHGPIRLTLLVEGQGLVGMLDDLAQVCVVEAQGSAADAGDVAERKPDAADGVPDADHFDEVALIIRVVEEEPFLEVETGFAFLVAFVELDVRHGRVGFEEAAAGNNTGETAGGERAAAETEEVDFIAGG